MKAKQHYVPQVLLRRFVDRQPPAGWPEDRPYKPAVWIVDRELQVPAVRRAPHNILYQNHLYTLANDSPTAPVVEEALGRIESAFGTAMARLQSGHTLQPAGLYAIIMFAACLRVRHPSWMDNWQGILDHVQHLYREVDRSLNDSESFSDEFWAGADEAGRRGAIEHVEGFSRILASLCGFVVNTAELPFVTSDQAVVHTYLDWQHLASNGFPRKLLSDQPTSGEALFYWAPLDPRIGLLASPHLSGLTGRVVATDNEIFPFILNELVRRSASEFIVSPIEDPFGSMKERLIASESEARSFLATRTGLELVLGLHRVWIGTTSQTRENGDHPLVTWIRFRTDDMEALHRAVTLGPIAEILEFANGAQIGFLRGGRFVSVASDPHSESIIESGPKDWPS